MTDDIVDTAVQRIISVYGSGDPVTGAAARAGVDPSAARTLSSLWGGAAAVGYTSGGTGLTTLTGEVATAAGRAAGVLADSAAHIAGARSALADLHAAYRGGVAALSAFPGIPGVNTALLTLASTTLSDATNRLSSDIVTTSGHAGRLAALRHTAGSRRRGANSTRKRKRRRRKRTGDAGSGKSAVKAAGRWLGTPYQWGGGGAKGRGSRGFDCSGLTQYAIAKATDGRVILPRTTYGQIHQGYRVAVSQARAGDLVFSNFNSSGPGHVSLAAGNGRIIEAGSNGVSYGPMPSGAVVRRVL